MYECDEHKWIYDRGSAVCTECGLVNEDDVQLVNGYVYIETKGGKRKEKINSRTRRAIKLDKRIKYQIKKNYLLDILLDVLAEIDISMIQKQLILNHVRKLNPKNIKDIFDYFILTVIKFEIPITNKAMLKVLKGYKLGKKAFDDFKYKQRNYDWYAWKLLSNLKFLLGVEMARTYKEVIERYRHIINKTIGIDPTALIGSLCYHIIREKFGDNSKSCYVDPRYRNIELFYINRMTYNNYKKKGYLKNNKDEK